MCGSLHHAYLPLGMHGKKWLWFLRLDTMFMFRVERKSFLLFKNLLASIVTKLDFSIKFLIDEFTQEGSRSTDNKICRK